MRADENHYQFHWDFFKSINPDADELFFLELTLKDLERKIKKGKKEIDFSNDRNETIEDYLREQKKKDFYFQKKYKKILIHKMNAMSNPENTADNFINDLLYFSTKVCNIPLEEQKIQSLLYLDSEEFLQSEFMDSESFLFQEGLIHANDKKVNLILRNLTKAIKTNCKNNIDLTKVDIPKDWGWSVKEVKQERSIYKKYANYKISPKNENDFKKIWLKQFIQEIEKIQTSILEILNLTPETPQQKATKPELTLKQIALLYIYNGDHITAENNNSIAEKYGNNSGHRLQQHYNKYALSTDRNSSGSRRKDQSLIKDIEKVIEYLPKGKQNKPKEEAERLRNIVQNND